MKGMNNNVFFIPLLCLFLCVFTIIGLRISESTNFPKNLEAVRVLRTWNEEELFSQAKDFSRTESGVWTSTSNDPWTMIELDQRGGKLLVFNLELLNREKLICQLFFRLEEESFSQGNSSYCELCSGRNEIDISWRDVDYVRVDLTGEEGVKVRMESIEVFQPEEQLSLQARRRIVQALLFSVIASLLISIILTGVSGLRKRAEGIIAGFANLIAAYPKTSLLVFVMLTGMLCYGRLLFCGSVYVYTDIGSDTVFSYIPFYFSWIDRIPQNSGSVWVGNYGLGSPVLPLLSFLIDPFAWPTLILGQIFGKTAALYSLAWMQIMRILTASMICYAWLGSFSLRRCSRVFSAWIYGFCGFLILWGQHYCIATGFVLSSLVLLYFERTLREAHFSRQHVLLSLSVAALAAFSYYFAFMSLLSLAFYAVIRIVRMKEQSGKVKFLRLSVIASTVMIGLLISCALSIPQAYWMLSSTDRLAEAGLQNLANYPVLLEKKRIITVLGRMLSSNLFGVGNNYRGGWNNYYESEQLFFSGFMPALLIVFPFVSSGRGERTRFLLMTLVLVIAPFLYITGMVYNVFAYTFGRYTYLLMPAYAYVFAVVSERLPGCPKRQAVVGLLVASGVYFAIIAFLFMKLELTGRIYCGFLLALMAVFLLLIITARHSEKASFGYYVSFSLLILCSLVCEAYPIVNYRFLLSVTPQHTWETVQDASEWLAREDASNYRIERTFEDSFFYNAALAENYNSISFYNSVPNKGIKMFFQNCWPKAIYHYNFKKYWFADDQTNADMAALLGVKYLISETEIGSDDYVLKHRMGDRLFLYENTKYTGFCRMYTSVMGQNDFEALEPNIRQQVLQDTLVLEGIEGIDSKNTSARVELGKIVRDSVIRGTVDSDGEGWLFLPIPYDEGWKASINGNDTAVCKADYGFIAIPINENSRTFALEYHLPCLNVGIVFSCFGVLLLVAFALYGKKCGYRYPRKSHK